MRGLAQNSFSDAQTAKNFTDLTSAILALTHHFPLKKLRTNVELVAENGGDL